MLIDWFTVGAQLVNFVILLWLMKRFLYQPILAAIDAREKRIAGELAAAERSKTEAQHQRDEFQSKNDEFEQQRATLFTQAREDADAERRTLIEEARLAADALATKRQATLHDETKALVLAVQQRAQSEVFAIARQALSDLASVSLETSICAVFVAHLRALEGEQKAALAVALKGAATVGAERLPDNTASRILIRSAFDLPSAQRSAIQQTISEHFGITPALRYESTPELVSGIELVVSGAKVSWSIGDYLQSLDREINKILNSRVHPSVAAAINNTAPQTPTTDTSDTSDTKNDAAIATPGTA